MCASFQRCSFDPDECGRAIAAAEVIDLDVETTGTAFTDVIVSAAVLVRDTVFVLPVRSRHTTVTNLPLADFRRALAPLARPTLKVGGHNLPFDLGKLRREGVHVCGVIYDTMRLLRLLDSDRGAERGTDGRHRPRVDRRSRKFLNYRLKAAVRQLLGVRMLDFPGPAAWLSLEELRRYSISDVLGTAALRRFLWSRLSPQVRSYYLRVVAPLVPMLVEMSAAGIAADRSFIVRESARLEDLMKRLSAEHAARYGVPLDRGDPTLRQWIYGSLRLPVPRGGRVRQAGRWVPSVKVEVLRALRAANANPAVGDSLLLVEQYAQARSLMSRLRNLTRHVSPDGRFHGDFDDRQTSGRISSADPNLQAIPKFKRIAGQEFRCRNVLVATAGCTFAVYDVKQADIRSIAHALATFPLSTAEHIDRLLQQSPLPPRWLCYQDQVRASLNPEYRDTPAQPTPQFDPRNPNALVEDLSDPSKDFYWIAARRVLGRDPRNTDERNELKRVILGTVNSQGAETLAKQLKCSEDKARDYLRQFDRAYPELSAFRHLMTLQAALTGGTETFLGRPRTITPHRWMVTEPRLELFLSYKRGDKYWLEVVPLKASLRVLVCYVLQAWDANRRSKNLRKRIYHHERGRLSTLPYRLFQSPYPLLYRLPVRGVAWRSVRRVRTASEWAFYEGFDRTARQLFNHIAQGNTSDIVKLMMLRAVPVCRRFGARLLLQVHDELVFEVPDRALAPFLRAMRKTLEEKPTADFAVPILVETKRGKSFGSLEEVDPRELSDRWPVRARYRLVCWLRRWAHRLRRLAGRLWECVRRAAGFRWGPRAGARDARA
jgi:DNA polymerase I-like protein with 3'-5' exonuclease and polymerase domains